MTTATIVPPAVIAMTMTQSSNLSSVSIEAASKSHASLFAVYVGFMLFAAIGTALLTWLVWRSGNNLQDAIRAESTAKIESLRRDVLIQQERAAVAEADLERIRQQAAPRRLTNAQRSTLIERLKASKGRLVVVSQMLDSESSDFADDLDAVLHEAGWETLRVKNWIGHGFGVSIGFMSGTPEKDLQGLRDFAEVLRSIGVDTGETVFPEGDGSMSPHVEAGVAYLLIAQKPMLVGVKAK